jgi:hypothetical protein
LTFDPPSGSTGRARHVAGHQQTAVRKRQKNSASRLYFRASVTDTAAKKTARAAKPAAGRKLRGMVVPILKLASRPKGVSPAELNALTKWKGAPWK